MKWFLRRGLEVFKAWIGFQCERRERIWFCFSTIASCSIFVCTSCLSIWLPLILPSIWATVDMDDWNRRLWHSEKNAFHKGEAILTTWSQINDFFLMIKLGKNQNLNKNLFKKLGRKEKVKKRKNVEDKHLTPSHQEKTGKNPLLPGGPMVFPVVLGLPTLSFSYSGSLHVSPAFISHYSSFSLWL